MLSTMSASPFDAAQSKRIAEIGRRVLDGAEIDRSQALELWAVDSPADLGDMLAWANRIRLHFKGNRIHLCSIVNVKAGGCAEDCKFCAQSARYATDSPRYGFIEREPVLAAADEAARNGVVGLGLVAAWRGLDEGPILDAVCDRIADIKRHGGVRPDASLGLIRNPRVAQRLRGAGLECYNHNLETSRRFFPQQCSTHTYDDRLETLGHLRDAGIRICSGGIIGLGESVEDRCDLALALRDAGAHIVPLNILNPIPGTPFADNPPLTVVEILKTIACFRFILPRQEIMIAGGRVVNLRDAQSLIFFAGASALMVGNYLTTVNRPVEEDLRLLRDLGLDPRWQPVHPDVVGGARTSPSAAQNMCTVPAAGGPPALRADNFGMHGLAAASPLSG
jgi:biotin synthase